MIFNKNGFTPQELSFVKRAIKKTSKAIDSITETLSHLVVSEYSTDSTKVYNTTYINTMIGDIETALISLRGVISDGNRGPVASTRKRQKRNT